MNEPTDVTFKLVAKFKSLISRGVFAPGDKLPPERELSRMFAVNRSSLRQAIKVLQVLGVLRQRVGDGTYLARGASHVLHEPLDFLRLMGEISDEEFYDARYIVEGELAALAAERATARDVRALREVLKDMAKAKSLRARIEADCAFHEAVFRASGNRLCGLIFSVIHRAIQVSIAEMVTEPGRKRQMRPHSLDIQFNPKRWLGFHKAIYSAIDRRKPGEARRRMAAHILDTKAQFATYKEKRDNLERSRFAATRK